MGVLISPIHEQQINYRVHATGSTVQGHIINNARRAAALESTITAASLDSLVKHRTV